MNNSVEKPCSLNNIPSQFISIDAYKQWREEIWDTTTKIKYNLYPGANGNYDLDDPPSFSLFSPVSWIRRIHYYTTFLAPPVLLEQDRVALEDKNTQIKKHINHVDPIIKKLMLVDRGLIVQTFALMERAREKLRKKYPGYPLEHQEIPVKPSSNIAILFLFYISLIFPVFLDKLGGFINFNLSTAFNFIPSALVPAYSRMASISLDPVQTLTFLSYCFYCTFIIAILTYRDPPLKIRYRSHKFFYILRMAVSGCIIFPMFLCPSMWLLFFNETTYYSPFILVFGLLAAGYAGELLGVVAFKLKHQFFTTDQ